MTFVGFTLIIISDLRLLDRNSTKIEYAIISACSKRLDLSYFAQELVNVCRFLKNTAAFR
jgi:hypothetical protein